MLRGSRQKERKTTNPLDSKTLTVNERILKECHSLYADPDTGLAKIAEDLQLKLLAPRKKITVLLIGNHSAGKSSFINWYVEEHVQKTGVAIETQGITFVTSGRKRETLTGHATLQLYPHFSPLREINGIMDSMVTEISTSKQKKFSLVTMVDTPGLVDGNMKYPFDVNKTILWLGDLADLIFVFFDPIGQALCKRTLNLVEALNESHPEKIHFYLSKADEAGPEHDRQRVLMQIVQELCKRPGLNKTNFDMPTIYIPNTGTEAGSGRSASRCVNRIDDVCVTIDKTIQHTIQNTLNTLEKDCERIATMVNDAVAEDDASRAYNNSARCKSFLFYLLGVFMFLLITLSFMDDGSFTFLLGSFMTPDTVQPTLKYWNYVQKTWMFIPAEYHVKALVVLLLVPLVLIIVAATYRRKPTLSAKRKKLLQGHKVYVEDMVKTKKPALYDEYLKQCAAEQDF